MGTESTTTTVEELLAQRDWVRSLARGLVFDRNRAEDLEQEAWLRALRRPPSRSGSLRAWFSRVVRTANVDAHRTESHRRDRERAADTGPNRIEPMRGEPEVVGRAGAHQQVVDAVMALAEPYRTTVLLRFFEGLGVAAVARRTGAPVETVRTRLRRALERLREDLDRRHGGDRRGWLAPVSALALSAPTKGILAMTAVKKAAVAVVLVLVLFAGWQVVVPALTRSGEPGGPPPDDGAVSSRTADPGTATAPRGPGRLTGRVLRWDTREPVRDREIGLAGPDDLRLAVRTGDDGGFVFPDLPPADGYSVRAGSIAVTDIDLTDEPVRDLGTLWLADRLGLRVEVIDAAGRPVAEAQVAAHLRPGLQHASGDVLIWERRDRRGPAEPVHEPSGTARTGADGAAEIAPLMPGCYAVTADGEGYARVVDEEVLVAPGRPNARVRLLLPAGLRIEGRLLEADGTPVPDAVVAAARDEWGDEADDARWRHWRTAAGPDGVFVLTGLPSAALRLTVDDGHGTCIRFEAVRLREDRRLELRLPPRGGTLAGRVTNEAGDPVAGARVKVEIEVYGEDDQLATVELSPTTDVDGRYEIQRVPRGSGWRFRVTAPGYTPYPGPGEPPVRGYGGITPGAVLVRDAVLRHGASAVVRLRRGDDGPAPGVRIRAERLRDDYEGRMARFATTDDDGTARFRGLLPGEYILAFRGDGVVQDGMPEAWWRWKYYSQMLPRRWILRVPAGATTVEAEFRLDRGTTVSGLVVDRTGAPVAGAWVRIPGSTDSRPVVTGADGRFLVAAVPASDFTEATARAPGFAEGRSAPFAVSSGEVVEDVTIVLPPGGVVAGTVRAADGDAVSGAVVRAGEDAPRPVREDGSYEIDGLPAGPHEIRAGARGYVPASVTVDVTPDARTPVPLLRLEPAREIVGRVTDGAGASLSGARVIARDPTRGTELGPALTDARGGFRIGGLSAGAVTVRADAIGHRAAEVTVEAGAEEARIVLPAGRTIRGRVTDPAGRPVSGVEVRIEEPFESETTTGPDGAFELCGPAEGAVDVEVDPKGIGGLVGTLRPGVRAGASGLEVVLAPGMAIEGRVVPPPGEPALGLRVSCSVTTGDRPDWWDSWYGPSCDTGEDGTFRLAGLPPGSYRLRVSDEHYSGNLDDVPAGERGVVVPLRLGRHSLRIHLLDEHGVATVTIRRIEIRPADVGEWERVSSAFLGGRGYETVAMDATPGPWDVRIVPQGRPAVEVSRVDPDGDPITVRLPPGARIEGRVVGPDGRPVDGAELRLVPPDESPPGTGETVDFRTREDGRFSFGGLSPEPRRLMALAPGLGCAAIGPVRPGAEELEVRLPPRLALRGAVRDEAGDPRAEVEITLVLDGGRPAGKTKTRADGAFDFYYAPAGAPLTLLVRPPGTAEPLVREIAADDPRDAVEIVVR